MTDVLMKTYARLPVTFVRGEGAWLWDSNGKRYLDALAGVAVCGLGHAHPAVTDAICGQAAKLLHTSNYYHIEAQEELGGRLAALSGMDGVFFCNSGAEANEAAIKLARLYGHSRGIELPTIVVAEASFHGRTLATLTATGNRKVQAGFEPLVQGFARVPYNDPEALRVVARNSPQVVAVLLEPIQGEGGVVVPDSEYLREVRAICDEHAWLLILDEVQTGVGRTGRWFAHQHAGIAPDVMTLAKGLGNGVPIGACLARGSAADLMQPGSHGSTFGGNPLACRAALAVLDTVEAGKLMAHAASVGEWIQSRLRSELAAMDCVRAVRGKGLMLGIELTHPCQKLMARALERGLLLNVTAERVIRLLPPLILTMDQAEQLVAMVVELVGGFDAELCEGR